MIVFNKLDVTSFKSIYNIKLDFNNLENGLYSLEGVNNTVDFANSNGSGKSTIWDALSFVLYGTTMGIYVKKEEYQNKFSNIPLKIVVDFNITNEAANNNYIIERTLNNTVLFKNGENISELTKSETDNKILKIIQLTKEEFFSFTYLTQTAGGNFLGKTASEKLAVIKNFIFGEDVTAIKQKIDNILKITKTQLQECSNNLSRVEGVLAGLQRSTDAASDTVDLASIEEVEVAKKKLEVLKKKQKDRRTIEHEITVLTSDYNKQKETMQGLKSQLLQVKNNICPLCKQHLLNNDVEIQIREQATVVKSNAEDIKQKLNFWTEKLSLVENVDDDIQKLTQKISHDSLVLDRKNKQNDILHEIEAKKTEQQTLTNQVQRLQNKVEQLTELQKYFNTVFIQYIQQSFVKEIENYLNLYCYDVFCQDFSLKFSNNSLDLFVGDHPYSYFSGGERQRIDLLFVFAIKVALMNFTNKYTNLLIFDESLSGSDIEAFNNTVELIDSLSTASNLITILVSHRETNNIKNKIVIERNKNNTNLEILRS